MHTPKRQLLKGSYQELNNSHRSPGPSEPQSSSLVEQGLSLLGLSPTRSATSGNNNNDYHYDTSVTPNRKRIGRKKSQERQTKKSQSASALQFLSSDAASVADLNPYPDNHHFNHATCEPNLNINLNANNNHHGRKARRRKLNWRVGPLQKKKSKAQQLRQQQLRQQQQQKNDLNTSMSSEDNSIAEKTVKSVHTLNSTETVKVGNNEQHKFSTRFYQQQQQQQQQYSQGDEFQQTASISFSIPPRTPNSDYSDNKKTIMSSFIPKPSLASPTSTAATTPSSESFSFLQSDDEEDDDGHGYGRNGENGDLYGAFITPSSESPQFDRSVGLFANNKENSSNASTNSSTSASFNKNRGRIVSQKRIKGLPPRSPYLKMNSYNGDITNVNLQQYNNENKNDDDSASNESGGPLWQLAKLQAQSEGPIPAISKEQQYQSHQQWKTSKSSSSRSVSSAQSASTTDPAEVQMRQAERNLRAIHALAQQHLKFNELPEAIDVLQEMLRGVTELHGEGHYRVGTVLHNITTVFMRARMYKEAIYYCRDAIDVRKRALGPFHPDLAVSYSHMGIAYLEMEEHAEAVRYFELALAIRRKTLSSADPKIARLLNNIGCSLYESGKLEEAASSFEEALTIQKSVMHEVSGGRMGNNSAQQNTNDVFLSIASTLCNLGSVKMRWKKYDEAVLALEEALLLQQSLLDDNHPTVQSTKDSIAVVNRTRSNPAHKVYRGIFNLAESLKEMKLRNDGPTSPIRCSAPNRGLKEMMSDVMSMKKVDWNEIFEEFLGQQKLCSVDTTDTAGSDNINESVSEESIHDFYLI